MKKKGKIILTVVLVLAIAAVVAAVAAFRPQPVLDPAGTYEVQRVNYWLEGPNLEWEGLPAHHAHPRAGPGDSGPAGGV